MPSKFEYLYINDIIILSIIKIFKLHFKGIKSRTDSKNKYNYCNYPNPNHAVALVGYDTDSNGNQYYILRNQWGTSWGMNGYMHFARNNNNMCGIADNAFYVNVSAVLTGNENIPAYYLTSSKMSLNLFQNYTFNFFLLNLIISYFFN